MPRRKVGVGVRVNHALVCFLTCRRCQHEVAIDPIDTTESGLEQMRQEYLERMRQECPRNEDNWYVVEEG